MNFENLTKTPLLVTCPECSWPIDSDIYQCPKCGLKEAGEYSEKYCKYILERWEKNPNHCESKCVSDDPFREIYLLIEFGIKPKPKPPKATGKGKIIKYGNRYYTIVKCPVCSREVSLGRLHHLVFGLS